jgi:hypothetical protein
VSEARQIEERVAQEVLRWVLILNRSEAEKIFCVLCAKIYDNNQNILWAPKIRLHLNGSLGNKLGAMLTPNQCK